MEKKETYLLAHIAATLANMSVTDVLALADEYARSKTQIEPQIRSKEEDVEYLYRLYPTKCLRGGKEASTGKCAKDKRRLMTLLQTRTRDDIEKVINEYVAECDGNYLKNFSTFLNNLPESGGTLFREDESETNIYQDVR